MFLILKIVAIVAGLFRIAGLLNAGAIFLSTVPLETTDASAGASCPAAMWAESRPVPGSFLPPTSLGGVIALDSWATAQPQDAPEPCPSPHANGKETGSASALASGSNHAAHAADAHATAARAPAGSGSSAQDAHAASASDGPTRDGAYWIETVTGNQTIPPGNTLRLSSIGPVSLAGDDGKDIRYSLVKRVKATTEAEARRLLDRFVVRSGYSGTTTRIEVAHGSGAGHSAEIRVLVPRSLRVVGIETHGGDVDASTLDGGLVAATGGGRMKVSHIGGGVEARTAGGEIDLDEVAGSVKCATAGGSIRASSIRGEAAFQTGGGEIHVDEVGGLVRAVTAGGDIRIRSAGGQVIANTAGGAIQIDEARGEVVAETLGGSIEIGSAAGIRCETAGGGIRLNNVSGRVNAATAVGNVVAKLASNRSMTDSYLATNAGDITVKIPPGLSLTIRAEYQRTAGARTIISDFPGIQVRNQGAFSYAEGTINGGGPVLRLSALNGTIHLEKRQE